MTLIEEKHNAALRVLPCVVCRRIYSPEKLKQFLLEMEESQAKPQVEVHHVAAGSALRSEFGGVPLCMQHHRGKYGLHGMGVKAFCACYDVPWLKEEGLLLWVIEDLARA